MTSVDGEFLMIEGFAKKAERLLPEHPSLFAGLSGLSLMYAEMYQLYQIDHYRDRSVQLIEKSIALLNDKYSELTLANGVAGVGWTIKYLLKNKLIAQGDEDILNDFDQLLLEGLREDDFFENQTYDLLYGLIGKGIYFLEDEREPNNLALKLVFERLMSISTNNSRGVIWYDNLGREKLKVEDNYMNYGLAHGLPGIIVFLSRLYEKNVCPQECVTLIKSLVQQIKAAELHGRQSSYPIDSRTTDGSKLSWCYGDIGIAIAFLKASAILPDRNLENEANNLFLRSAKRKLNEAFIRTGINMVENGFCHGSFGLSYLFHQAYIKTKQIELKEASNYWISVDNSQLISTPSETLSKSYDFDNNVWQENGSLLNGYCGMGLVLLSLRSKGCNALGNITLTAM